MADFDVQKLAEEAARAQYRSRTDLDGFDRLIARQKRSWVEDSTAALAVIVPAVTEQIRALHQPNPTLEYLPNGVRIPWKACSCGCPTHTACPTVRLLDELDDAARGEQ